jgi:Transglycosylase SLT domain
MTDFSDDDILFWDGRARARRAARQPGERTRTHHVVTRRAPLPPLERDREAEFWHDDTPSVDAWIPTLEPARPRPARGPGVDPRLLRLGVAVVALVLMVPIALAMRRDDGGEVRSQDPTGLVSANTVDPDAPTERPERAERRMRKTSRTSTTTAASPAAANVSAKSSTDDESQPMAVAMRARPEPECAGQYTVVDGDYWWRFADSEADLDAWLSANGASLDTPLYAGDVLCVPEGESAPAPPTTAAPTTTDAPATSAAPPATEPPAPADPTTTDAPTTTGAPPTTAAPTTTDPPTTSAPPPPDPPADPGDVEAIIRQIWPDDLEDRALVIAERESSLQPNAYNGWCCYGLFQIYFDANRSFLGSLGVTTAQQLFDARTNATVAYAMYQRSGWSPWSSTNY